ncbi:MAG TPA: hypothetical protein VM183_12920 [Burkholderiales bacterium]|nr:hypothetical protein [Burkholderiales bacterium]
MAKTTRPAKVARSTRRGASRARKISITVDESVLREVKREAKQAGRTLSAYVTEVLDGNLRRTRLRRLIEEYEAEHGAITDEERAATRAEWDSLSTPER